MQLIVFCREEEVKIVATAENTTVALQDAYIDKNEVVILEDQSTGWYMQTAGGWHIEYQADLTQYVAEQIPFTIALNLFLSFAEQDDHWKSAVDWTVDAGITATIRAAQSGEIKKPQGVDPDVDLELDAEGVLQWTDSGDSWAQENLKDWQQTVTAAQIKVNDCYMIYPREWYSLLMPIWNSRSLIPSHNWRGQLNPEQQNRFDELVPVANGLAAKMEVSFWLQQLHALDLRSIASISTMRSMLKEIREVHNFLTNSEVESVHHPEVRKELQRLKEKFAWYRARTKVDEAEIAEALGQVKESEKLRIEACVMLKQDWQEVFAGEEVSEEKLAKIS